LPGCSTPSQRRPDTQASASHLAHTGPAAGETDGAFSFARPDADTIAIRAATPLGMAYGVAELERRAACRRGGETLLTLTGDESTAPRLTWRSVQIFLGNRDHDEVWYQSDAFWDDYLAQLIACRFNNLSLTFGHQSNYLTPPYPFLVPLPEFPDLRLDGFTDAERDANLRRLQTVSRLTRAHGLHFTLGIWTQCPGPFGDVMVTGVADDDWARLNEIGLARLLEACPEIDGVQLRLNYESGIPEAEQFAFYQAQFRVLADCGRPLRVDLRAKGLADSVVAAAQEVLPDVVVSTKFWCEHLGQPYAMPAIQQADQPHYRRYGYWDLLARPRTTPLIYRLWTAGSQRALAWGAPSWVRRFAAACGDDTDGFEIMAPLTNKGGLNEPGAWPVRTDIDTVGHALGEHDRFHLFYTLFGRLGYDGDCSDNVWRRELRLRADHDDAADALLQAYEAGGQILTLVTVVMQWSASLWGYWPELFAGRTLSEDLTTEPSDPTQFYGVNDYVDHALSGQLDGRWTPSQTAALLGQLADAAEEGAANAGKAPAAVDSHVLALLGRYHAHRLTALTHLALALRTRADSRRLAAVAAMTRARDTWAQLADLTADVFHHDLVFGRREFGHCGHWQSEQPAVDAQLAWLHGLAREAWLRDVDRAYPGESARPMQPVVEWTAPAATSADSDLPVIIRVCDRDVTAVICHAKPMLQPLAFCQLPLRRTDDSWCCRVPMDQIDARFDLLLFFELRLADGDAVRWPDWRERTPYFRIRTEA
jgi:hypothetical protein